MGADTTVQKELLQEISGLLKDTRDALLALKEAEKKASVMKQGKEQAFFYKEVVRECMEALRVPADQLEMLVDKRIWPFPTYADLLFEI